MDQEYWSVIRVSRSEVEQCLDRKPSDVEMEIVSIKLAEALTENGQWNDALQAACEAVRS